MNIFQSIRFRIIAICIVFAAVINLSYSQLIVLMTEESQDDVFNWHLAHKASSWADLYAKDNSLFDNIEKLDKDIFIGRENQLIEYLSKKHNIESEVRTHAVVKLLNWEPVLHVDDESHQHVLVYEIFYKNVRLHIAQAQLVSSDESLSLYYIVDLSDLNQQLVGSDWDSLILQLFIFIITIGLACLIGIYLANRAVLPLTQLSHDVDAARIEQKFTLKRQYYNDEVGILAQRLSAMFERIESFVEREKLFSRDASHELRTPITNIQIAIELAKSMPQCEDEKVQQVLNRVARSNRDMIHLVETFLLLGREESKKELLILCDLNKMTAESLEKNRYLVNNESLIILNEVDEEARVKQPQKVLAIVLNNLVRNSFQYTHKGNITVRGSNKFLEIEDTGIGFTHNKEFKLYDNQHESGLGLGLNIVQRICYLKGWQLHIDSNPEEGTRVRVTF